MMNFFVISDIHGMYPQLKKMLTHWDPDSQLIILGDLIDRGSDSYEVVTEMMHLQQAHPEKVVILKGNHEDMLQYFVEGRMQDPTPFLANGGTEMLRSFIPHFEQLTISQSIELLKKHFAKELNFLFQARRFYQVGKLLFTHAGFDTTKATWQETAPHDFLWIRKHYERPNQTTLINIFGHTPTRNIHETDAIWQSQCGTYIGIDGGCSHGGQLNGLYISEDGGIVAKYVVKSTTHD